MLKRLGQTAALAAVMVVTAGLGLATAAAAATQVFTIHKDGKPIGEEVYTFANGPDGTLTVDVTTRTDVQVLFLDFHFRHARTEVWKNGDFVSMTAETDDDGTPHALALKREDGALRVEADGTVRREPADALPLSLWTPKVLERGRLLSIIDAEPFAVTARKVGADPVNGRDAVRWELSGDVDRDLWYSPEGELLKVQFVRSGYDIEYLRTR